MNAVAEKINETIRELVAKIPNVEDIIREVKKAPETPVADVAYVYNGYDDITLSYLGRYKYEFKRGQITRIDPLPNHREINQNDSTANTVVWRLIPLKGESIARELVETRGFHERGMVVWTDNRIPKEQRDAADERGRRFILTEIERFKIGRDKARAGTPGYKLKPDPSVYRWMEEHCPDDDLFGERHRKSDAQMDLTKAIAMLTKIIGQDKGVSEPVDVGPIPRRRPLETPEAYQQRLTAFLGGGDGLTGSTDSENPV